MADVFVRFPIGTLAEKLAWGLPIDPVPPIEDALPASNDGPQFLHCGRFSLESGEELSDLTICYETWGTPNRFQSNIIVLCHERSGDHLSLAGLIGADRAFDPERYYIVAMDALGSGQSTSPSKSGLGMRFPRYTIRDMVRAQCLALTAGLGFTQLRCVAGASMGAYMALEWAVNYIPFVKSSVCIAPSAQCTPQLRAVHDSMRAVLSTSMGWPDHPDGKVVEALGLVEFPWSYGEEWYLQYQQEAQYQERLSHVRERAREYDPIDLWYQMLACDSHDVTEPFDGDLAATLARCKSALLVMPSASDILVPPRNAELMHRRLPNSELVEIPSYAGHAAGVLETSFISGTIRDFLSKNSL